MFFVLTEYSFDKYPLGIVLLLHSSTNPLKLLISFMVFRHHTEAKRTARGLGAKRSRTPFSIISFILMLHSSNVILLRNSLCELNEGPEIPLPLGF